MTSDHADVVVIGAGVIGCAVAYALAKEGLQVTVVERAQVGAEASGAAAGILAPRIHATEPQMFELAVASERQFASLTAELREETGLDVEYGPSPGLELAYDEATAEDLRAKAAGLQVRGHPAEWLEPADVLQLEPRLEPSLLGALCDRAGTQIHPYRFTQALAQAAARRGVRFDIGVEAYALPRDGRRASGVRTTRGDLRAGQVVLAAGAWTGLWSPSLGAPVPVFPARGQILALRALPTPVSSVVYAQGVYLLPRMDGTTVLGATYERVGFDKSVTAHGLESLLARARQFCPAIAEARFERAWAGLRPGSEDEQPIIGRAPGWDNLVLATGHYRNGIMLAPVTAAVVADLVLGRPTADLPLDRVSPSRFQPG